MQETTIGIGGAAGDGLDKSGDAFAKTASRLGLHVFAYNSYQSVIRGGHIWLRIRVGEEKVSSHGDHLNVLLALNQDSIERHAREVEPGGIVLFNADKIRCDASLLRKGVTALPLPIGELAKSTGKFLPVMQNTIGLGAILYLLGLEFETLTAVLTDTFQHKGKEVVEQNVALARAGFEFAKGQLKPLGLRWKFSKVRRPFLTGNEAIALGAVTAGCKFYSAYPMTPASSILHWMVAHAEQCGVVVKQCEDELAVANMAIGAGHTGVRAMCGTSGGGFALMTEAIGMAGMIEAPVVIVNVQRAGPSTGVPTKTEQADLNQVFGASQGDYPRAILAPTDVADCFWTAVEAFNLAEKYQMPVILISDLLLSEHPETVEPDAFSHKVPIDRGEIEGEGNGHETTKRYRFTPSGVSPRVLPGTKGRAYVAATDDHDEEGILISDVFTSPPVRRKSVEKRARKIEGLLREIPPPRLEGAKDAEVTLVGWGSTMGAIREALALLRAKGIAGNQLQFKYLVPFRSKETLAILKGCKRTICVENNQSGQFARHLRAETGHSVSDCILKYDGEPFQPGEIAAQTEAILKGKPRSLDVTSEEAREMAYHYLRSHLGEELRPGKIEKTDGNGRSEPVWLVEVVSRETGEKKGELEIGVRTGANHSWTPKER